MARRKKAKPVEQYDEPLVVEPEPRPTLAITDAICKWVRDGVVLEQAALVEGVDRDELNEWIRCGEDSDAPEHYAAFLFSIRRAEATAEATVIGRIKSAAKGDWKAAAWLAERNWPERYMRRSVQDPESPRRQSEGAQRSADDPFTQLDNVVDIRGQRGSTRTD